MLGYKRCTALAIIFVYIFTLLTSPISAYAQNAQIEKMPFSKTNLVTYNQSLPKYYEYLDKKLIETDTIGQNILVALNKKNMTLDDAKSKIVSTAKSSASSLMQGWLNQYGTASINFGSSNLLDPGGISLDL